MNPILSVIIISFDSKNYLDQCLSSLSQTRLKQKMEVIVIDNASTDNTKDLIPKKYKQVKFIRNCVNLGFAAANNQAIDLSKGKYVLLLNPDTIVPPATLPFMLKFAEQHGSSGVSTCKVVLANGSLDDACHRGFPTPWNAFCHFTYLSRLFPHSLLFNGYHLGFQNLDKIHQIDSCSGAFMLIKREVGIKLNWLDENYFWYGEDLDFCFRAKMKGFKVFFVPDVTITHYKGISSGIKKHSQSLSSAGYETKYKATIARFAVMRTFYRKHYQKGRLNSFGFIIFAAILLKEQFSLLSLKIKHKYAHRI